MRSHEEFDLLSAYLDGELDAAERARLEAHVPGCAECSGALSALRATVAELATLPQPEMSPEDRWALRGAIARRRERPARWSRVAMASSGVAAAVVAVLAITLNGGLGGRQAAVDRAGAENLAFSRDDQEIQTDYSRADAEALLLQSTTLAASGVRTRDTSQPDAYFSAQEYGGPASTTQGSDASAIPRCEDAIFTGVKDRPVLMSSIVARFEGTPAYLLTYQDRATNPTRAELWVVDRTDCRVLFFSQRRY